MSDQFKDFLAQREAQQASREGTQRWFWVLIALAVVVVLAVVVMRGDPSKKILDPNTATAEELATLPEVGPAMAKAILDKRAEKPFTKPEDLLDVKGIGPKTLAKMKPRLKFEK
jgi:competence protein ComEA